MTEYSPQPDRLICEMDNVRGGEEGFPVSIYKDAESGRFVIRGLNEGGSSCVDIDLLDVVLWLTRETQGLINADSVTAACRLRKHAG